MDTTPKYIKMCEMAEEIQGTWKPQVGDYACISERPHNNDLREPVVLDNVSSSQGVISFSALGLRNGYGAA